MQLEVTESFTITYYWGFWWSNQNDDGFIIEFPGVGVVTSQSSEDNTSRMLDYVISGAQVIV